MKLVSAQVEGSFGVVNIARGSPLRIVITTNRAEIQDFDLPTQLTAAAQFLSRRLEDTTYPLVVETAERILGQFLDHAETEAVR